VAACLERAGHLPAAGEADADLILVNTCSVRGKAEDKAIGKLGLLCATKRDFPLRRVGVMGCMAQRRGAALLKQMPGLDFVVGTRRQGDLPRVVARLAAGERGILLLDDPDAPPDVPAAHLPRAVTAFVTILLGCNRRCAYCVVPDVRGAEYSRPAADVLAEIRELAASGVREVTAPRPKRHELRPLQPGLGPRLARPGRIPRGLSAPAGRGQRHPRSAARPVHLRPSVRCTDELAAALRDLPGVCPHLHLPVQSGSDRILTLMRRGYTAAQYLDTVARLRTAVPDLALTTDVIVGFPTESAEDFEATRRFMDAATFDNAFVFKYSPRPNTPAAAMRDDVPTHEKQRRNQVLLADQDVRSQRLNDACVGRTLAVLAEGVSLRQ